MKIRLKFYGVFKTAVRANELSVEVGERMPTVRSVITQVVSQKEFEGLKHLLFENENPDPRPNALIMVSGREINTLQGLETPLAPNDDLALLPVAHGG